MGLSAYPPIRCGTIVSNGVCASLCEHAAGKALAAYQHESNPFSSIQRRHNRWKACAVARRYSAWLFAVEWLTVHVWQDDTASEFTIQGCQFGFFEARHRRSQGGAKEAMAPKNV